MTPKIRKALETLTLLKGLSPAFLDRVAESSMIRVVRAGETVFCQGEPSPYCFGVLSGEVMIQLVSKNAQYPSKLLGIVGPGDLFGEGSLFEDNPRTAMASVRKDGELIAIFGSKFREDILKDPSMGVPLLMGLLNRSLERLHQTSQELSVVYGIVRIIGSEKPFEERMSAALDYLKTSIEGVDDILLFQRSPFWEEFEPICVPADHAPVKALPVTHPVADTARTLTTAVALNSGFCNSLTDAQGGPWTEAMNSAAVVPLIDRDTAEPFMQGFVLLSCRQPVTPFTQDRQLLLTAVAAPLAEAVARHRRQQDASAQSRLEKSRQTYSH